MIDKMIYDDLPIANCDKNHSYIKYAEGMKLGIKEANVEISSNRTG